MRTAAAFVVLIALTGCGNAFRLSFGAAKVDVPLYVTPNPSLIEGDPTAGRRAFIDLHCIDCHRVAEDPHLPKSGRADSGPLLAKLNRYSGNQLVEKIRNTKTGKDQEYLGRTMKDYTEPMTTRQLVDVVAYLRNPHLPGS